VAFPAPQ